MELSGVLNAPTVTRRSCLKWAEMASGATGPRWKAQHHCPLQGTDVAGNFIDTYDASHRFRKYEPQSTSLIDSYIPMFAGELVTVIPRFKVEV